GRRLVVRIRRRAVGRAGRVRVLVDLVVGLRVGLLAAVARALLALGARHDLDVVLVVGRGADRDRAGAEVASDVTRGRGRDRVDSDRGPDGHAAPGRRGVRLHAGAEVGGRLD